MLVKNDYVNKRNVVYVRENDSLEDTMKKIAESGYRCIPVLDETETYYIGNIYKVDLLKHEKAHSLSTGSLADLIDNKEDGSIKEDAAFFKVFNNIKRLPYLAVVSDTNEFLGILTNGNVIQVLEGAWGVEEGSYSFTIGTFEYAGALRKILGLINKYSTVQSVISLKNTLEYVRRVCIVLPIDVDEKTADKMKEDLERNGFTVTHVEKLD